MKHLNKIFPVIIFALLSLVIVFPLLPAGYILTLDTVVAAKIPFPSFFSSSFMLDCFRALASRIFPSYWLQKMMLFVIFFFSGWGMHRLLPIKNEMAKYFAGIFYTINPFVYERVMAGQWNLLLGYALFPLFIADALTLFHDPNRKAAIKLAILSTIIINFTTHYSLIIASAFIVYFIFFTIFYPEKILETTKYLLVFTGLCLILNLNWLVPTFIGKSQLNYTIGQFNNEDLIVFQSIEDKHFGLIFNLLSGYGFWPETYSYFTIPKDIIFFWPIISMVFIIISLYGLFWSLKEKVTYPLTITFVIMFLISLDFAGGIALRPIAATVFALYEKIPILRGFREPQKLVGIIMFCYAFFGSVGLFYLQKRMKTNIKYVVIGIFLLLPFIYTPTFFGSFWRQLTPVFYPESWNKVNKLLNQDIDKFTTLFFPWHQHMRFSFNNNRVIASPAIIFFDKPILSSQNYETKYLYSHDSRPEALHVEGLLSIEKTGTNLVGEPVEENISLGDAFSVIDVKYIILAKEDDWKSYHFLDSSPDINKVYEDGEMILYQNLNWGKEMSGT